jgi:DNA-binding IscR family transcriptional regulator
VVRRLFSALAEAGLARARLGQGGGFELARAADRVTLLDVYLAVEEADLFAAPRSTPNPGCVVGCHIQAALAPATERARRAMEEELARTSIADVARRVRERAADELPPLA